MDSNENQVLRSSILLDDLVSDADNGATQIDIRHKRAFSHKKTSCRFGGKRSSGLA
jgi:hypothetical protein